jgi:ABC-type xylose transport system permease subunit
MKKAVITGFFTGVIISAILICAAYVRPFLPDTFTANLFYMTFFFTSIVCVLWLSLNFYCKRSAVKWMTLSITGMIASVIAAILVTLFRAPLSYALYNFRDLSVVLLLISISIAAIYYVRNRNRIPDHANSKNQELIF